MPLGQAISISLLCAKNSLIGLPIAKRRSEKKATRAARCAPTQRADPSLEHVEFPADIAVNRELRRRGVRWRLRAPPDDILYIVDKDKKLLNFCSPSIRLYP